MLNLLWLLHVFIFNILNPLSENHGSVTGVTITKANN